MKQATTQAKRAGFVDRHFVLFAVAPTAIVMFLVFGIPLAVSAFLSVTASVPGAVTFDPRFAGLTNFYDLFSDPRFWTSLRLTIIYTFLAVSFELILGFMVALLLHVDLPGTRPLRAAISVPMMMTPIVAALCWKLLLDPRSGVVNNAFGLEIIWLGDPFYAQISVLLVNVWQNTPYVALLLLAGLRSMSREPLEAAAIDGATRLQILFLVIIPMMRTHLLVAALLRTIFELRAFENVFVMTSGGPADATMLLSIYTYLISFADFDVHLGASAAWVMLAISVALSAAFVVALNKESDR
jgi:multiple sugar transport system permease protein